MRTPVELLIGIDVGTTNVKCGLYDTSARLVALATRSTATAYSSPGELDPDRLWAITARACAEAVSKATAVRATAVRGVAVSSIGCVPVLLDAADRPVNTAVPEAARLRAVAQLAEIVPPPEDRAITGYPLDMHSAACRLAALPAHDKDRTRSAMSVADYIAFRLTGRIVREFSTALSYGLWDYRHDTWWTDGLERIGLDARVLGEPADSGRPIGPLTREAAAAIGVEPTTMVFTGGHDYLTAALAADLHPGLEVLNVTGTIEILASIHRDRAGTAVDRRVRAITDHHVVPGVYSYMIEAYGAGLVEWLRGSVLSRPGDPDPDLDPWFTALERLPPAATAAGALYVPPRFARPLPEGDPRAAGAFVGVGPDSSGAMLLRTMVEGLCFQVRQMLECQQVVLGPGEIGITSVGGGSRSAVWSQTKADVLARPIRVPRIIEASALGAALLAGIGAGVYGGFAEAGATAAALGADVIEPEPGRSARYRDVFETAYLPMVAELDDGDPHPDTVLALDPGQA